MHFLKLIISITFLLKIAQLNIIKRLSQDKLDRLSVNIE